MSRPSWRASRLTATPAMTDDNQLNFNLPSVSRKGLHDRVYEGRLWRGRFLAASRLIWAGVHSAQRGSRSACALIRLHVGTGPTCAMPAILLSGTRAAVI